jgi:hypothetical protein
MKEPNVKSFQEPSAEELAKAIRKYVVNRLDFFRETPVLTCYCDNDGNHCAIMLYE